MKVSKLHVLKIKVDILYRIPVVHFENIFNDLLFKLLYFFVK